MNNKLSVVLLVLANLFACQSNKPSKEFYTEINGKRIPIIRLDLLKDSATVVPLSTLFEDVEIIPLETRPECLIGYCSTYMTGHSVFTAVRNYGAPIRLYEFDLKGKFIREIGGVGKGPGEHQGYMMGPITFYPEDSSVMASFAGADDEEHQFDRNGRFVRSVNLPWDLGGPVYRFSNDLYLSAGNISGVPKFKRDSFQLVLHKSNGDWVKSYPRKTYPQMNATGYSLNGNESLWRFSGSWRLLSSGNDTIYKITEKSFDPVALFNFGPNHRRENDFFEPQTEVGRYSVKVLRETDRFLYIKKEHLYKLDAEEVIPGRWLSTIYQDYSLILNNKEEGMSYNVRFTDDLLGILPPEKNGLDCSWDEFGPPYRIAHAIDVLDWIAKAKKDKTLTEKARQRILQLESTLNENSNPVLFLFRQRNEKEWSGRLGRIDN